MRGTKPGRGQHDLDTDEQIIALVRALNDLMPDAGKSPREELVTSALHTILGSTNVKFVRDDDEKLWPFVPSEDEDGLWRGPLRKNHENSSIEEARFDPVTGTIHWVKPWE